MPYEKITQQMRERARLAKEAKSAKIALDLYNAGIIPTVAQRSVSGDAIKEALERYLTALKEEAAKDSTGYRGKYTDVVNRAKMRIARGQALDIVDLACRASVYPDVTVYANNASIEKLGGKTRIQVEIKTGKGCIAAGRDMSEAYETLANACERDSWIVWYYDIGDFDIFKPDAWEDFDYLPYIFLPMGKLWELLEGYNGTIDTWLREPNPTTINFQNVSQKKLRFLDDLAAEYSYNWPIFRDTGKLVQA